MAVNKNLNICYISLSDLPSVMVFDLQVARCQDDMLMGQK